MIPDLQSSLICDDVRQERNGKFILIGLFDSIAVPKLPLMIPRLCMVNRWCCGTGTFKQRNRIISPASDLVLIEGQDVPVTLDGDEATATAVEFFMNVQFRDPGVYWVETLLDGDLKLRYPLRVSVVQQGSTHSGSTPSSESL